MLSILLPPFFSALSLSTPNVRKSSRQSLPNSSLILRRQLISDKFKILTPKTNRKTTPITYVKRKNAKVQKKLFAEKETKHSSDDVEILQNPVIKTDDVQSDQKPVTLLEKDAVVREKNANLLRKDANVLLKDANLLEIGRSFGKTLTVYTFFAASICCNNKMLFIMNSCNKRCRCHINIGSRHSSNVLSIGSRKFGHYCIQKSLTPSSFKHLISEGEFCDSRNSYCDLTFSSLRYNVNNYLMVRKHYLRYSVLLY